MLALIAFSVLFVLGSLAASGTAKLIMTLISPGELLGSWQAVLSRIEPQKGDRLFFLREFWYKRLGGCAICLRQFVAELSFIVLCLLFCAYSDFPSSVIDNFLLRWMVNIALFTGYCGLTLQIGQWFEERNEKKEEEKIIETRYRNN